MPFNSNIPQPNDRIKDSQDQLLQNFQAILALLEVNHGVVPFTMPASGNEGKHTSVQFVQQAVAPSTTATELALYTKAVAGLPQLFLRRQNNGIERDITSNISNQNGFSRLPSGLLMKWGVVQIAAGAPGIRNVPYPAGGNPGFTATPFTLQITSQQGALTNPIVSAVAAGTSSFNLWVANQVAAPFNATFLAISTG